MGWVRAGLAVLAAGQLVPGVWAIAAPHHFYLTFPGFLSAWVAADGPFNQHLVVDAGAGLAATGVALAVAAAWPRPGARLVALTAYLVHALPHLAYHVANPPAALGAGEQVLTWLPLLAGVGLALSLLLPRLLLGAAFAAAHRRLGTVPAAWRATAGVPRVALARVVGDAAHQRTRIVPERLGVLGTLRAATLVECAFCVDILSPAAAGAGVRPEQVAGLASWRDSDAFDADERLVLGLADAMTSTPAAVPPALVTALEERFGPDGVVELACTLGHENARARANRALGIAPQGFAAAAGCPVPGGGPA